MSNAGAVTLRLPARAVERIPRSHNLKLMSCRPLLVWWLAYNQLAHSTCTAAVTFTAQ
jgi:hypothetical protein